MKTNFVSAAVRLLAGSVGRRCGLRGGLPLALLLSASAGAQVVPPESLVLDGTSWCT